MNIITNCKDRGALLHAIREHLDKYIDGDITDRPLVLVVTSDSDNTGFAATDMDECDCCCPFQADAYQSAYEAGIDAERENSDDAIYDLKQEHQEELEDARKEAYNNGYSDGFGACANEE